MGPGTRALVMESSGGLVTGAVAERLGGLGGIVCSTFLGTKPPSLEITKAFNFEEKIKASIIRKPLSKLLESLRRAKQTCNEKESQLTKHEMQVDKNDGLEPTLELVPVPVNESVQAVTNDDVDGCQGHHDHGDNDDSPFSSCIVVMSTVEPKSAFFTLLPLLAPSSSFAILSPIMQSLAECMHALRTRECAVGMALQEVWFREQQMLPKRTHPMMNMNHGGGYLLSGTVTLSGSQLPIATACGNK